MANYLSSGRKTLTWSCGSFNATGTRLWLDPRIPPMVDRSRRTLVGTSCVGAVARPREIEMVETSDDWWKWTVPLQCPVPVSAQFLPRVSRTR